MMRHAFSVSIFARFAGRVLLVKHRRLGQWLPVGGELLPNETPLAGASRELHEETGLVGMFTGGVGRVAGTPAGFIGYEEHAAGSKGTHLNFCFVADVPSAQVVPNHEFGEFVWVDVAPQDDCPANVHELVRLSLAPRASLAHMVQRWVTAFNSRDLTALLALYRDDATHTTPRQAAALVGKQALRAWWQGAMERLPCLHYRVLRVTESDQHVFFEYMRENPGEVSRQVAEVLEVDAGGLISHSRVYLA